MSTPVENVKKEPSDVGQVSAPACPESAIGGAPVETYEGAWKKGFAAKKVMEIWNGKVERDGLYAVEAELPSIEWRLYDVHAGTRARLSLVLPPPREAPFDKDFLGARDVIATFVSAFLSDEGRGGDFDVRDGVAVLESFVKLCAMLYGYYSTRGIKAEVDDVGGDYTDITVRATWRG